MIPTPPELDEARREEARRQGGSNVEGALDLAGSVVDAVAGGAVEAADAALDATAAVAKVSLDVVGGILGGLADL